MDMNRGHDSLFNKVANKPRSVSLIKSTSTKVKFGGEASKHKRSRTMPKKLEKDSSAPNSQMKFRQKLEKKIKRHRAAKRRKRKVRRTFSQSHKSFILDYKKSSKAKLLH